MSQQDEGHRAARPAVTLAEAKAHLRVAHDDDDAMIQRYIAAAQGTSTGRTACSGFALEAQTLEARARRLPGG